VTWHFLDKGFLCYVELCAAAGIVSHQHRLEAYTVDGGPGTVLIYIYICIHTHTHLCVCVRERERKIYNYMHFTSGWV